MNKKAKVSRFKLQRRLLTELPGLGKPGALDRKPYPPGENGAKRIKYSDYRLQLEEKQKIRLHYNLKEEQLLRLVKFSKTKEGKWINTLSNLLERRLQNVLFRAGLARSQMSAAQMISHNHVLVNGKKVNIRSQILKSTDVVELTQKGLQNEAYLLSKHQPRLPCPDWIKKEESDTSVKVRIIDQPGLDSVPFPFDGALFTSYYSKV